MLGKLHREHAAAEGSALPSTRSPATYPERDCSRTQRRGRRPSPGVAPTFVYWTLQGHPVRSIVCVAMTVSNHQCATARPEIALCPGTALAVPGQRQGNVLGTSSSRDGRPTPLIRSQRVVAAVRIGRQHKCTTAHRQIRSVTLPRYCRSRCCRVGKPTTQQYGPPCSVTGRAALQEL